MPFYVQDCMHLHRPRPQERKMIFKKCTSVRAEFYVLQKAQMYFYCLWTIINLSEPVSGVPSSAGHFLACVPRRSTQTLFTDAPIVAALGPVLTSRVDNCNDSGDDASELVYFVVVRLWLCQPVAHASSAARPSKAVSTGGEERKRRLGTEVARLAKPSGGKPLLVSAGHEE